MTHKATLRLAFADAAEAARMAAAIEPENAGFVRTRVEGAALVVEADADAPLSLLRTLDDVLVCLQAAQRASRLAHT
jgi:uncharacterized protein YqfA (UPF0365 family)